MQAVKTSHMTIVKISGEYFLIVMYVVNHFLLSTRVGIPSHYYSAVRRMRPMNFCCHVTSTVHCQRNTPSSVMRSNEWKEKEIDDFPPWSLIFFQEGITTKTSYFYVHKKTTIYTSHSMARSKEVEACWIQIKVLKKPRYTDLEFFFLLWLWLDRIYDQENVTKFSYFYHHSMYR